MLIFQISTTDVLKLWVQLDTNTHVAKGMPNVIVLHSQNYKVRRVDLSCNWSYKEIPDQISKHMNQLHNAQGNPEP